VETGVNGVDVVIGTSSYLRDFSHGKSIDAIIEMTADVFEYLRRQNVEMRFSTEDSLRQPPGRFILAFIRLWMRMVLIGSGLGYGCIGTAARDHHIWCPLYVPAFGQILNFMAIMTPLRHCQCACRVRSRS
jgi:hypothetical protein